MRESPLEDHMAKDVADQSEERLDWTFSTAGSLKNVPGASNRFRSAFKIEVEMDDLPRSTAEALEAQMTSDGLALLKLVASKFGVPLK
jgi:hypothetical protein